MEILVKGYGEKAFKPDQIEMVFDFRVKAKDYDGALNKGVKNVEEYLKLLGTLGFDKNDVKTRNLRVSEDKVYNEMTRTYEKVGFVYSQNASLKFDYDMEKLATVMDKTTKLTTPPSYQIHFNVKENRAAEEEVIGLAYLDASFQAQSIAKAAGKTLKDCVKVSFRPFEEFLTSPTRYGGLETEKMSKASASAVETIQTIFVPEDVVASKDIYTIWIAE